MFSHCHATGILGATFVPCQAWTTAFFDKRIVGRANALVGGWGNSGGGFTFIIMVALYNKLRSDGLSQHSAWRGAATSRLVSYDPTLTIVASCICDRPRTCASVHRSCDPHLRYRPSMRPLARPLQGPGGSAARTGCTRSSGAE